MHAASALASLHSHSHAGCAVSLPLSTSYVTCARERSLWLASGIIVEHVDISVPEVESRPASSVTKRVSGTDAVRAATARAARDAYAHHLCSDVEAAAPRYRCLPLLAKEPPALSICSCATQRSRTQPQPVMAEEQRGSAPATIRHSEVAVRERPKAPSAATKESECRVPSAE